jgi:hypothetical protein
MEGQVDQAGHTISFANNKMASIDTEMVARGRLFKTILDHEFRAMSKGRLWRAIHALRNEGGSLPWLYTYTANTRIDDLASFCARLRDSLPPDSALQMDAGLPMTKPTLEIGQIMRAAGSAGLFARVDAMTAAGNARITPLTSETFDAGGPMPHFQIARLVTPGGPSGEKQIVITVSTSYNWGAWLPHRRGPGAAGYTWVPWNGEPLQEWVI